ELALLPIIESSYEPSATSNAAAAGLWQFIPSTGRIYGLNQSDNYDGRRDVIESTRAAYDFLTSLYNQFGSWELALAAYNAGPGRVQRAINANAVQGLPTDYWSLRLPTETMNYVPRFMAVAQIVANPSAHGVSLPAIANHQHFRTVPTHYGVSLMDISQLTGVNVDELQLLNPALKNLRVDATGPNRVVIPTSVPTTIDAKIQALSAYGTPTLALANAPAQTTSYIYPDSIGSTNPSSTQQLASANTLPTTNASLTTHNTIIQEPPLSEEERNFIAQQIRSSAPEVAQPINPTDGNIALDAVQTGQSVLEARGQTKALQYGDALMQEEASTTHMTATDSMSTTQEQASVQQGLVQSQSQAKVTEYYTVQSGDTLTSVAARHGLTVAKLASYNNLQTDAKLLRGQKLWLVAGKVTPKTEQPTQAKTNPPKTPAKQTANIATSTYKVRSGETLTGIANRLGVGVNELAELNGFDGNTRLLAGQSIKVPANTKAQSASTPPTSNTSSTSSYKVQAGDTLTSVAARFGVSIKELAAANKMSETANLIRGTTLTIPKTGKATTSNKSDANATSSQNAGRTLNNTESYTVKSGETLTALATRYGVSVSDLAKTNNLANNAQLRRGQTIKVPKLTTTHVVKSGESLNSLAKRYGISVTELATMNQLKTTDGLKIGQKLTVPNK
ncbi:MAG: LysM peptidoglycan-binding domain-containing protein, partial [Moraxella sp.]|nr:LysM peptidoglycan-binding domain-containing protein [Moraxella sp.]